MDKFPSTTTLWLILRKFESGAAGGAGPTRNFTARGTPQSANNDTGAGRLYYETPVLQVMGRELSSFADLQKTLGQLGFNSGSTLLRLSFRVSGTPFEETMEQIGEFFNSVDGREDKRAPADIAKIKDSTIETSETIDFKDITMKSLPTETTTSLIDNTDAPLLAKPSSGNEDKEDQVPINLPSLSDVTLPGPGHRPISVFAPPSSAIPYAARQEHIENDYEPTIDHAKHHQSRLSTTARNRRLPTDAEVALQQEAQEQKMASVKEVEIKVRFPDQTQVISKFSNTDTARNLYDFVKGMLDKEEEPFILSFSAAGGRKSVPREGSTKLIEGLRMMGRVLVNFIWEDGASLEARSGTILKEQYKESAREIEVEEVQSVEQIEELSEVGAGKEKETDGAKREVKGGQPRWLKLGKK
ncbi:hypothetical protein MMC12_002387 [Toensbergia leucococca]|nr:hypothetical protein [Toensbergia leucococca]